MNDLSKLLSKTNKIIIIYPVYEYISEKLEMAWPLVKKVREIPENYPGSYVSKRGVCGIQTESQEHIVELFTEYKGNHVEVMVKIYRNSIIPWTLWKDYFKGYTLAILPGHLLNIDETVIILDENSFDDGTNFLK